MNQWRQFLVPAVLFLLALGLLAFIIKGAANNTPAGRIKVLAKEQEARVDRAIWKPTPEQQELLDEAARTTPDPLSDDLVSVLAAIHKDYRDLIFFDNLESDFYLAARSWSLRDGYVTGDPREVDIFLDILREPVSDDFETFERSEARDFALIALKHVTVAGEPHRQRFREFEELAIAHIDTEQHEHAIRLLYLLYEANGLSEDGTKFLENWMERRPWLRDQLRRSAATTREYFLQKD